MRGADEHRAARVRRIESAVVEQLFKHRAPAPRTDVRGLLVDPHRAARELADRIGREVELDVLGYEQRFELESGLAVRG